MSVFSPVQIKCTACEADVPFQMVDSINVTRELTAPGLRSSILDRTFQKEVCPACGESFRVEPEFSYVDFNYGQFIGVWPVNLVNQCSEYEARTLDVFERAYGSQAPKEAQELGKRLKPQVVFGWNSLNEKLIAVDANIDDVNLELAKLSLIRAGDVLMDEKHQELRLLGADEEFGLVLGWFSLGSENLNEKITISKDILSEIESDSDSWHELKDDLVGGLFVDYRKLFLAAEATT